MLCERTVSPAVLNYPKVAGENVPPCEIEPVPLSFGEGRRGWDIEQKEKVILLRHYLKEGIPKTAIAGMLGINRRAVHR